MHDGEEAVHGENKTGNQGSDFIKVSSAETTGYSSWMVSRGC